MRTNSLYYSIKPLIPRKLQVLLRSVALRNMRPRFSHVWPIYEGSGEPPPKWRGWPENKKFALVLTHDVDTKRGQENCRQLAEMETRLGFRSAFNFVAKRYPVSTELQDYLRSRGFEIGLHGLYHDGQLYKSRRAFNERAIQINQYLKAWNTRGFRSPAMQHNLDWLLDLDIDYDSSTFDTDPFEPSFLGMHTIFPFVVRNREGTRSYVELPCTLSQDFSLFVLMKERTIDIWQRKLDWIAEKGGMALLLVHPDYINFNGVPNYEEYKAGLYEEFLHFVKAKYQDEYWHALPHEVAEYMKACYQPHPENLGHEHNGHKRKIWIDLDNSPHVPFFKPIIRELERKGHEVTVTARDCFQVSGLCELHQMPYIRVGKHYGKNKALKSLGTILRSLQLAPHLAGAKPDIAVSHGSRSQILAAAMLRVPSVVILDYEFANQIVRPTWRIMPEIIPREAVITNRDKVLLYPGIKEDVYAPDFVPDSRLLSELGLSGDDLLVTIRPPANEAHYHNPESEILLRETIESLSRLPAVKMILLPRNIRQEDMLRSQWKALFAAGRILIPPKVVDGLNLIWHSDLVISGGGTMNREAAALGVPVYSIFRGKIGAVDKYLAEIGRLTLIQSPSEVHTKIVVAKRERKTPNQIHTNETLQTIVGLIEQLL
jgi:uncharacterized protein